MVSTISRTDLARKTREVVERVRGGEPILVESYGEAQIVLVDALDYRILRALVQYATQETAQDDPLASTLHAYLDGQISLSKAAETLHLSRYDLLARFERLGIPLRIGPETPADARDEINTARRHRRSET